jgi:ribose 5-phosphate isomerase
MSYTAAHHITELPLERLPIDWSSVTEEGLAELEAQLQSSGDQQREDLEADRQAVIADIGKCEQQAEDTCEQHGVPEHRNLPEQ